MSIYSCATSDRAGSCTSDWAGLATLTSTLLTDYTATASLGSLEINPARYYFLNWYKTDGGNVTLSGTTSNNYTAGNCIHWNGVSWVACTNSVNDVYFIVNGDTCTTTGCTTTRFQWIYPVEGTSTSSRTVDFEYTYYFNSSTHDPNVYTRILFIACSLIDVTPFNNALNDCERVDFPNVITDQTVLATKEFTFNTDGAYILIGEFWNDVSTNSYCSWWEVFCDEERVQVLVPSAININVATTSISWDSLMGAVGNTKEITNILCGSTDAEWYDIADLTAGYMCKILIFLFYPDTTISGQNTQLNALWSSLGDKLPFALYFAPYDKFYDMSSETASNSFSAFSMPIMGLATMSFDFKAFKDDHGDFLDAITTPINYFLWFWFALYLFRDLTGSREK